jgi:hypothetical protein
MIENSFRKLCITGFVQIPAKLLPAFFCGEYFKQVQFRILQIITTFAIKGKILILKKQPKTFCGQQDYVQLYCKLIREHSNKSIMYTCSVATAIL